MVILYIIILHTIILHIIPASFSLVEAALKNGMKSCFFQYPQILQLIKVFALRIKNKSYVVRCRDMKVCCSCTIKKFQKL